MNTIAKLTCGLALATVTVTSQAVDVINVDIYSGIGTSAGGGAPYSGLVGSFTSPDIQFGTSTGYDWHPFGLGAFGADITGCLFFADTQGDGTGSGIFTLTSDDGSLLFIDGALVIDNGGAHGPSTVNSGLITLSAGMHEFELQFYEDFGGPSGVDLILPAGVSYVACPDGSSTVPDSGSTMGLLGGAMLLMGSLSRRLNRAATNGTNGVNP